MTSVKDLGDYFEEIVADYLQFVEAYPLVSRQHTFQYPKWIKHPSRPEKRIRVMYPGDLDVVAIRGDNMLLVSCKTKPLSAAEMRKEVDKLKQGRRILGLTRYRPSFAMAFAVEDKSDLARRAPCRVLFLDEIIKDLTKSVPGIKSGIIQGRYLWLLKKMWRFGLISQPED